MMSQYISFAHSIDLSQCCVNYLWTVVAYSVSGGIIATDNFNVKLNTAFPPEGSAPEKY
jgi:hypothetical protein